MAGSLLDPDGYYKLLGVDPLATHETIAAAHRRKLFEWHPDHNDSDNANEMTLAIIAAGSILLDPKRRDEYDMRARQEAGYSHRPSRPRDTPPPETPSRLPAVRSKLPDIYRGPVKVARNVATRWRDQARALCWVSFAGYALILTDTVSRFNPGFYDLSDGLEEIRLGSKGAPGALGWLVFWIAAALAAMVMMFITRYFRHGTKVTGAITAISVAPGIYVAIFSAIPLVLVALLLIGLAALVGAFFGG